MMVETPLGLAGEDILPFILKRQETSGDVHLHVSSSCVFFLFLVVLNARSAERVSDTLEESGHTTDQAHTPTRDTQPLPWVKEVGERLRRTSDDDGS